MIKCIHHIAPLYQYIGAAMYVLYSQPCIYISHALAVYTVHRLGACISKQVMIGKVPREREQIMEPLKYFRNSR